MIRPCDISVVVPVGGGAPHWARSARSLGRLDPSPGEILVVLDGRGAALAEHRVIAERLGAEVVELERRSGPAAARNRGASQARGEVLFFLDADIEVPTDLVLRVAQSFESTSVGGSDVEEGTPPGKGAAENAAIIGSYDDTPGDPGFVSQYRNLLHHYVHQTSRETASTFWSGCGAVRRQAFLSSGGFDEGYADPSIEDIELGARLRASGYGIRLAKSLQVKHLKRWTLGTMVHTDLFRRAIPWTEQMLGSGGLVNDLNVKTRDRLSVVLAFLIPLLLLCALWVPAFRLLGGVCLAMSVGLLLLLNWGFLRFLSRVRGPIFAVSASPLYWIYLLICGLGFGLGFLSHLLRRPDDEPRRPGPGLDPDPGPR